MDLKAFFKLNYGLYIVFSESEGKSNGCIINTATQVTAEPVKMAVTVSKENFTTKLIQASQKFAVSVLSEDVDMDMVRVFGFENGEKIDKYEGLESKMTANGIKVTTKDSVAMFECKVEQTVDLGTHLMFIGEALDAEVLSEQDGLTYTDYHRVKNGGTPKNAPSYQEEVAETKKGYRCKICGYVAEMDELPEGYICPLCKKGVEFFEKL